MDDFSVSSTASVASVSERGVYFCLVHDVLLPSRKCLVLRCTVSFQWFPNSYAIPGNDAAGCRKKKKQVDYTMAGRLAGSHDLSRQLCTGYVESEKKTKKVMAERRLINDTDKTKMVTS